MARKRKHEEHQNHEAWAIPYADLITLLLAFFVVMYAISSVNEGKYRVVSASLSAAFNGAPKRPNAVDLGDPATGNSQSLPSDEVRKLVTAGMVGGIVVNRKTDKSAALSAQDVAAALKAAQIEAGLLRMQGDISTALAELIRNKQVSVRRNGNNIEVQISADVLFPSGSAQLSSKAVGALQALAGSMQNFPNVVRVQGHTDNRPIRTAQFQSNWELSSARAASVVHLFMDRGIDPQRLAVMGMSQYSPIDDNSTVAGRNANRRVTVIVVGDQVAGATSPTDPGNTSAGTPAPPRAATAPADADGSAAANGAANPRGAAGLSGGIAAPSTAAPPGTPLP